MAITTFKRKPGYPVPDCPAVWKRYRKGQQLRVILFAIYVFSCFFWLAVSGLVTRLWHWQAPDYVFFAPMGLTTLVIVMKGSVATSMNCPNCGYRFFAWGPFGLGYSQHVRRCRNCGLHKWACPDPP